MENKVNCNICNKLIVENNLEEHVSSNEHINNKNIIIKTKQFNWRESDILSKSFLLIKKKEKI